MKKNTFRTIFLNYLNTYIAIFLAYFLSATYSEYNQISSDYSYTTGLEFYALVSVLQSVFVLLVYYIISELIFKIEFSNYKIFLIIFISTCSFFIISKLFETQNPIFYLMSYIIGIGGYGYYFKYLKKIK